jgi:hypothetical protein
MKGSNAHELRNLIPLTRFVRRNQDYGIGRATSLRYPGRADLSQASHLQPQDKVGRELSGTVSTLQNRGSLCLRFFDQVAQCSLGHIVKPAVWFIEHEHIYGTEERLSNDELLSIPLRK